VIFFFTSLRTPESWPAWVLGNIVWVFQSSVDIFCHVLNKNGHSFFSFQENDGPHFLFLFILKHLVVNRPSKVYKGLKRYRHLVDLLLKSTSRESIASLAQMLLRF